MPLSTYFIADDWTLHAPKANESDLALAICSNADLSYDGKRRRFMKVRFVSHLLEAKGEAAGTKYQLVEAVLRTREYSRIHTVDEKSYV